jgi:hypothetical protein
LYEEIINDAKVQLEKKKDFYSNLKTTQDSLRNDSIKKIKLKEKLDTIDTSDIVLDTIKTNIKKGLNLKKKNSIKKN